MIGIVVAMHGDLADALLGTAKFVLKDLGEHVVAVGIKSGDDALGYEHRLKEAVERVHGARGTLILTDMFGGTPSNIGLMLHKPGEVEVLTGANLPMLIKALHVSRHETLDLSTAARQIKETGERAITVASEVLGIGKPKTQKETSA